MGDIMRPIPFEELLTRLFDEYQQQRSIFGIPEQQFYSPEKGKSVSVFGETCATPVGPAAGPHTQLAQNIITAWLTGSSNSKPSRFSIGWSWKNPVLMRRMSASIPNGQLNLPC